MNAAMRAESAAIQSYAAALLNVARAKGIVSELRKEAEFVTESLAANPQLQAFLDGPNIPTEKKAALVDRVFEGRLHPVLHKLLRMLIARARTTLLPGALAEFEEAARRAEGIYPGSVTTARPLEDDDRKRLQAALEKSARCKLVLEFHVKPDLLGGVVFRYKDVMVDGSVRHGLNEIKRRFEGDGSQAA